MTLPAALRRSAAHVVIADVGAPALDEAADHHLRRVLRLRPGAAVTVTDGAGAWRVCALGDGLEPTTAVERVESPEPVTIGVAIPKQDRPEWIVQKLTELGVTRIVLLESERSVVRWPADRAGRHLDRLSRVAIEAVQQSRRVWLPAIEGPVSAASFLPGAVAAEPGGRPIGAGDRVVGVGPEGGWSDAELALAADRVGLGDGVLRVETAALTAAVLLSPVTLGPDAW